jgi:bidirectional [NiFe] hydrogenase diaphorase subunit
MVKDTSLCGLGQSAPNPVLSTLRFFRHEYTELLHAPEGYVPAGTANEKSTTQ